MKDDLIVGLGGWALSGKDTVADKLVELYGYRKTYMSKPLEEALIALDPPIPMVIDDLIEAVVAYRKAHNKIYDFPPLYIIQYSELHEIVGYAESKREPWVRHLLQKLGTEVGRRMFSETVWIDKVVQEVQNGSDYPYWAITGIRFPNEMDALHQMGGVSVWVTRPGIEPINTHASDNSLGPEDFDIIVDNHGSLADIHPLCYKLHGGLSMSPPLHELKKLTGEQLVHR